MTAYCPNCNTNISNRRANLIPCPTCGHKMRRGYGIKDPTTAAAALERREAIIAARKEARA